MINTKISIESRLTAPGGLLRLLLMAAPGDLVAFELASIKSAAGDAEAPRRVVGVLVSVVGAVSYIAVPGSLGDSKSQHKFRSTKGGSLAGCFTPVDSQALTKYAEDDDDEDTVKFPPNLCTFSVMKAWEKAEESELTAHSRLSGGPSFTKASASSTNVVTVGMLGQMMLDQKKDFASMLALAMQTGNAATKPSAAAGSRSGPPTTMSWEKLLGMPPESEDGSEGDDESDDQVKKNPKRRPTTSIAAPSGAANIALDQNMVNLEMIKALRKMSRGRGAESSSEEEGEKNRSLGFEGVHRLRRRVLTRPKKVLEEYVCDVKDRLGITSDQQIFHLRDWSKRVRSRFGRLRGLWRCHNMLSEILQRQITGEHQIASAMVVQMQKVLVQVSVDMGNWDTAQLLWPLADMEETIAFGGGESEMRAAHRYKKALAELKGTGKKKAEGTASEEVEEKVDKPKFNKRGQRRGGGAGRGAAAPAEQ